MIQKKVLKANTHVFILFFNGEKNVDNTPYAHNIKSAKFNCGILIEKSIKKKIINY